MLTYDRLSRKPHLFKSFTGLSVKQFDDFFKEIESKYPKHEIRRLKTNRKDDGRKRERAIGAGRHFNIQARKRNIPSRIYIHLTRMD